MTAHLHKHVYIDGHKHKTKARAQLRVQMCVHTLSLSPGNPMFIGEGLQHVHAHTPCGAVLGRAMGSVAGSACAALRPGWLLTATALRCGA